MTDRELFAWLCDKVVDGVNGVYRQKVGSAKHKAAVIIGTHGKEVTSGLRILRYLIEPPNRLRNCDLTIAIGNIDAAAMAMKAQGDDWKQFRFTPGGQDMNRLPADLSQLSGTTPEGRRARALMKALDNPQLVLDIHSTDGASVPAGLGIVGETSLTDDVFRHIGAVETVYTDVCAVQASRGTKTRPHSAIYGAKLAMELEVGQTGTPEAMETGLSVFLDWAAYFGFITRAPGTPSAKNVFRVVDSIMAPDTSFRVIDSTLLLEHVPVKAGEVLLRSTDGRAVSAEFDGELIWCPGTWELDDSDVKSEVWFQVQRA